MGSLFIASYDGPSAMAIAERIMSDASGSKEAKDNEAPVWSFDPRLPGSDAGAFVLRRYDDKLRRDLFLPAATNHDRADGFLVRGLQASIGIAAPARVSIIVDSPHARIIASQFDLLIAKSKAYERQSKEPYVSMGFRFATGSVSHDASSVRLELDAPQEGSALTQLVALLHGTPPFL
jgi:hypothetical protein